MGAAACQRAQVVEPHSLRVASIVGLLVRVVVDVGRLCFCCVVVQQNS